MGSRSFRPPAALPHLPRCSLPATTVWFALTNEIDHFWRGRAVNGYINQWNARVFVRFGDRQHVAHNLACDRLCKTN